MKIKVVFFANFKELLGLSELTLEIEDEAVVRELSQSLLARGERWKNLFENNTIKVAVNHELVDQEHILKEGDEVAFFPPVTGG